MIRTSSECFSLDAKRLVSFPIEDKYAVNEHLLSAFDPPAAFYPSLQSVFYTDQHSLFSYHSCSVWATCRIEFELYITKSMSFQTKMGPPLCNLKLKHIYS